MNLKNFFIKLLSTFFFVGYFPLIPGTFGSVAGTLIFYIIYANNLVYLGVTALLLLLGFLVTAGAEKVFNKKDPSCVVIDEVAGMLIALYMVPADIKAVFLAFLFFRIFDILKPFPACKIQDIRGSVGIMADDIIAGLYANITVQLVLRFASFKAS